MENTIYSIYKISCAINGKCYIGMTKRKPLYRWSQHKHAVKHNLQEGKVLYRAIKKHNIDNFIFQVIYQTKNLSHAKSMEKYFIEIHNSYRFGYNMTIGGEGIWGLKMSRETRDKLSKIKKEQYKNNPMVRQKYRDAAIESFKKMSDETKKSKSKKVSNSLKKFYQNNTHHSKGRLHTEEHKKLLSKIMKECGHKPNEAAIKQTILREQKVWLVTDPSGHTFEIVNLRKFCRENNLCCENLWKTSKGIINQSQGWSCKKIDK